MPYLIKEYSNGGFTAQEQYFGKTLCQSCMIIKCSFGRLKAHFGALKRPMDINLDKLPHVILHNFCKLNNKRIEEKLASSMDYDKDFQPVVSTNIIVIRQGEKESQGH